MQGAMYSRPSPEAGPQSPGATRRSILIPEARQLEHRPEADRTPVPAQGPSMGSMHALRYLEDLQHMHGPGH